MKLLIKIPLIILGVVLAAAVGLAIFLPLYFDPNDYKAEIAAAVKEQTGRDLAIPGNIELMLFPWLGMKIGEASLGNAPGFGGESFAEIREVEARVRLMPLLRKEIQVGTVTLDGLVLRLAKNAAGGNNWDDIGRHREQLAAAEEKKPEQKKAGGEFEMKSLEVSAVEVKNSAVSWDDAQTGSHYKLERFRFTTGQLRPGVPFLVDTGFVLNSEKPKMSAELNAEGKVEPDLAAGSYRVKGLELTVDATGENIPGGKQKATLTGDVDFNQKQQRLQVANLVLQALGAKVTGQVSGTQVVDNASFTGNIRAESINPRELMQVMGSKPPVTADDSVLTKASLDGRFTATKNSANFQGLQLKLDDTTMNGSLSVANFSHPAIGFALALDQIDVDRYLAPASEGGTKTAAGSEGGKPGGATEIPVDMIKSLNLNGTLKVAKLKLKNLRFENADLTVRARDGRLEIEPLTANFYQGRIQMFSRVDASGPKPAYALTAQMDNIIIEPMLADLFGKAAVNGAARLNLNVTSAGSTTQAIRNALNGTMNLEFRDGAIKGFNLGQKLRAANALRQGQKLTDREPQSTDFALVTATLNIVNGVISNNDLAGKSPAFRVGGDGKASLVSDSIDYLAKIAVVDTSKGQGGEELDDLRDLTIPVRIYGPLNAPQWKIDLEGVLKEKVKAKLDEKKEEAQEKLKGKLDEKLQDYLGGGKSKPATGTAPATAAPAGSSGTSGTTAPSTTAPATTAPAKQTEAEKKAAKKAAKEKALRELLGVPEEKAAEPAPAPAPEPAPAPAPATEPAPAGDATPAQ